VDPEVAKIVRDSALKLEKIGEVDEVDIEIPNLEFDLITKVVLETVTMLDGMFDGWEEKVYPAYQGFLPMAETIDFKEYVGIQENVQKLLKALRPLFKEHDFLITPTVATPPFEIEGASGLSVPVAGKPSSALGWMPFTYPFNFTLQPAASIPAGFTKDGLPVGMQIVGRGLDDAGVLRVSKAYEEINPWQEVQLRDLDIPPQHIC
jgi:aspartyl-tRNA(Asn)/glutamyl-tRNA(Gln) amidotransferase subunit A